MLQGGILNVFCRKVRVRCSVYALLFLLPFSFSFPCLVCLPFPFYCVYSFCFLRSDILLYYLMCVLCVYVFVFVMCVSLMLLVSILFVLFVKLCYCMLCVRCFVACHVGAFGELCLLAMMLVHAIYLTMLLL